MPQQSLVSFLQAFEVALQESVGFLCRQIQDVGDQMVFLSQDSHCCALSSWPLSAWSEPGCQCRTEVD